MKLPLHVVIWGLTCWLPLRADVQVPAAPGPEGQRAFTDLAVLYAKGQGHEFAPPAELAELNGKDLAKSQRAGDYLLALFEQSWADETDGRASWHALPFWGGGADNPARTFRGSLADAFGKSAFSPNALPAALWLIEHDLVSENIAAGAQVLARIHDAAADAAIGTLLQERHPNQAALVMALQEAGSRRLVQDKSSVIALEQSYRSAVRKAAQTAALQLGEAHAQEYDRTAPLAPREVEFLKNCAARMTPQLPAQAVWQKERGGVEPVQGWLIDTTPLQWGLLDSFAEENWVFKSKSQLESVPLSAVAEDVISRRAKVISLQAAANGNDQAQWEVQGALSREGMLTGQFEPRFISLPEITVAAWCWQRGDLDHCRRLLDPCYDLADDDRWLDMASRDYLGNVYHRLMISKFCDDQDFPAALALARHLEEPVFDGYFYQPRAKELAAQLTRQDAEVDVSLPSVPVWSVLQLFLSREGQITYLARRLKLLHVVQDMQPGDVYYDDSKPSDLTTIYCINPYLELERMNLSAHELGALAPFAADQDFTLTYSYFRNFHPSRTLHRVSWTVQKLVNDIAGKPASRVGTLQEMLNGTAPKPTEILSHDGDGLVYFTANPSGDVAQELKAWAEAQPADGFLAHWWQTPVALLVCYAILRANLKRRSFRRVQLKSLIFIFFLVAIMAGIFSPYVGVPSVLNQLSSLAAEIAKIFCWVWVVRLLFSIGSWLARRKAAPTP